MIFEIATLTLYQVDLCTEKLFLHFIYVEILIFRIYSPSCCAMMVQSESSVCLTSGDCVQISSLLLFPQVSLYGLTNQRSVPPKNGNTMRTELALVNK